MRKVKRTGRMKKHTGMLMMTAILVCGLTACQSTEETNGSDTLEVSEQESVNNTSEVQESITAAEETESMQGESGQLGSGQEQQGNRYMGEITAIEDNVITITAMGGGQIPGGMPGGKMPNGEFSEGEMPESAQPAVKPEGAPAEGELPEGFEAEKKPEGFEPGEIPEGFEPGEIPEGFEPGEMPEGETMVIEVSDDTVITVNDENGEVSNLKVGDFIQFTMDGELVTEINVGMMQQNVPQQKTEEDTKTE